MIVHLTAPLFLALSLATALPALAQPVAGAEDPAYREAVTRALTGDDPLSNDALHALAEAGNAAALAVLPFALLWTPPKGSLAERNRLRKVNGAPLGALAAEQHAATAHWAAGAAGSPDELITRAEALIAFGEGAKADMLLLNYLQATGLGGKIPEVFLHQDRPDWLLALGLTSRLSFQATSGDGALLADLLKKDRLAAWMTLARLRETGRAGPFDAHLQPVLAAMDPNTVAARLEDAAAMSALAIAGQRTTPLSAETLARARALLAGRPELSLISAFCSAHCPATAKTCETAFLSDPGLPVGWVEARQPFADLVPTDSFLRSEIGLMTLLQTRKDPAADGDRDTASGLDACYASLLEQAATLRAKR
ncbi:hypothetical protein ACSBLW_18495 [Thioclava sp. FR2]|uniref:hypothetical protein n=1 Tax=Thioclava sp. FR2 TaxID=3445780 RepID=UPI003EB6F402